MSTVGNILLSNPPSWILPGASLDLNFANSQYYQQGVGNSVSSLTTTTRASVGYVDDTLGNWVSIPVNTPRISNKGLLVEESRTNSIRNNSMQGTVAGSPGTLPTNWYSDGIPGWMTRTIIGTGTQNGIDYIDIQYQGTPTSTISFSVGPEQLTVAIPASNGQTWSASSFTAVVGGDMTNTSITTSLDYRNSSGTGLSGTVIVGGSSATSTTATLTRNFIAGTAGDATVAYVDMLWRLLCTINLPINVTIRFGWPQLELGSFATSPIRTTSAAVTRAMDAVTTLAVPAFGSSYTLFCKATPNAPVTYGTHQFSFSISDGTTANRVELFRTQTTANASFVVTGSSVGASNAPAASWAQGVSGKTIGAAFPSPHSTVFNGGTPAGVANVNQPVGLNKVTIGSSGAITQSFNGYMERVALWSISRLPDATLQALTT